MSFHSRDRLTRQADLFTTPYVPPAGWLQRAILTLSMWRHRIEMRRCLANMDARSLREAGISPAAAAFEAGKPFWCKVGSLR